MIKTNSKRKGFILAYAMFVPIIVSIVLYLVLSVVLSNYSIAKTNDNSQKAYYGAQAGVEYALFIIKNSGTYDPNNPRGAVAGKTDWPKGDNFDSSNANITVSINGDGSGGYYITSTGTVLNETRRIGVELNSSGEVNNWEPLKV